MIEESLAGTVIVVDEVVVVDAVEEAVVTVGAAEDAVVTVGAVEEAVVTVADVEDAVVTAAVVDIEEDAAGSNELVDAVAAVVLVNNVVRDESTLELAVEEAVVVDDEVIDAVEISAAPSLLSCAAGACVVVGT